MPDATPKQQDRELETPFGCKATIVDFRNHDTHLTQRPVVAWITIDRPTINRKEYGKLTYELQELWADRGWQWRAHVNEHLTDSAREQVREWLGSLIPDAVADYLAPLTDEDIVRLRHDRIRNKLTEAAWKIVRGEVGGSTDADIATVMYSMLEANQNGVSFKDQYFNNA